MEIIRKYSFYGKDVLRIDTDIMEALRSIAGENIEKRTLQIGCWGTLTPIVNVQGNKLVVQEKVFGYNSQKHNQGLACNIIIDTERRLGLCTQEGQGERFSHGKRIGILFGVDDGHLFSVRVPSTCESIEEAIEFLKPAKVKKAEQQGRKVVRQGEWFFVESRKEKNMTSKGRHTVVRTETGFEISHPEHTTLMLVGHNWEMVRNRRQVGKMNIFKD